MASSTHADEPVKTDPDKTTGELMNRPTQPAAPGADALLDDCMTEAVVILAEAEALAASESRREDVLARLLVTVDELESLLDDVEVDSPASADACDVIATARQLCGQPTRPNGGQVWSSHLAA